MKTYSKLLLILAFGLSACGKKGGDPPPLVPPPPVTPPPVVNSDVANWVTSGDRGILFQKRNIALNFSTGTAAAPVIQVDSTQTYQTIDGFGYCLTGGSAGLIHQLPAGQRSALLRELFLTDSTNIGVSYLRISIGASDLSSRIFSYDDNTNDSSLTYFDLSDDKADLVPLLQEIVALNPSIRILACPWSPPTWMKDNNNAKGGSLLYKFYPVYAKYFVKYIQAMKAAGIAIDAITPQNEPLNPSNVPSLLMQDT
ncbi:MAG TPA: glucosylceramidase, partial [Puia sp.]